MQITQEETGTGGDPESMIGGGEEEENACSVSDPQEKPFSTDPPDENEKGTWQETAEEGALQEREETSEKEEDEEEEERNTCVYCREHEDTEDGEGAMASEACGQWGCDTASSEWIWFFTEVMEEDRTEAHVQSCPVCPDCLAQPAEKGYVRMPEIADENDDWKRPLDTGRSQDQKLKTRRVPMCPCLLRLANPSWVAHLTSSGGVGKNGAPASCTALLLSRPMLKSDCARFSDSLTIVKPVLRG